MKKIFVLCVSFLMFSHLTYAEVNTIRTCSLSEWCSLPRPADVAYFPVDQLTGDSYTCTITTDKKITEGWLSLSMEGTDGFNFPIETCTLQANTAGAACRVEGSFNGLTGKLKIRRWPDSSPYVGKSYVMCEKT